jgi:hypothetical protein
MIVTASETFIHRMNQICSEYARGAVTFPWMRSTTIQYLLKDFPTEADPEISGLEGSARMWMGSFSGHPERVGRNFFRSEEHSIIFPTAVMRP